MSFSDPLPPPTSDYSLDMHTYFKPVKTVQGLVGSETPSFPLTSSM